MGVLILTKQTRMEEFYGFVHRMESMYKWARVFYDSAEFYASLNFMNRDEVDFVVIDVRTFQMDAFNPYVSVKNSNCPVPVVIFNDPYPEPGERTAYWISKNKSYYKDFLTQEKIDSMSPALKHLESVMNEKVLSVRSILYGKKSSFDLDELRLRRNIKNSRFKLLSYLYKNESLPLMEEDICRYMWQEYTDKNRRNLYSYIYDLRQILADEGIRIERPSKGVYSLFVQKAH